MGMTAAVLGSLALNDALQTQRAEARGSGLTGLASAFQKRLSHAMADLWKLVTDQDRRWPMVEVVEEVDLARRQRQRLVARMTQVMSRKRDDAAGSAGLAPIYI
jgi:hypothetical protein